METVHYRLSQANEQVDAWSDALLPGRSRCERQTQSARYCSARLTATLLIAAMFAALSPREIQAQQIVNDERGTATRPNVLVILVDDLGYSDLGFMGSEIETPNLDRLANRSIRFTQCYNSARCCPSRAALMTGLYPHQAGIGSFVSRQPDPDRGPAYLGRLNDRTVTIAEVLSAHDYQTLMVGKWHLEEPGPTERGFDEFYGFVHGYEQDQWKPERYQRLPPGRNAELSYEPGEFYATDVFTDYAIEFLKQARQNSDQPWFLYVAHSAPHFPVQAPRSSVEPLVATYLKGWDRLREERFERMKASGLADESWKLTELSEVPIDDEAISNGFSGLPNPRWDQVDADRQVDLAHRMAIYAAMVRHVDQGVGRLLADLEANGELENTLIVVTSDNGACYEWGPWGFDGPSRQANTTLHAGDELAGMGGPGTYHAYGSAWANLCNTPLRSYKHFTYEGGTTSPLLLHWPAGTKDPGRWCHTPIHLFDLLPTLCEATGAIYPSERNGVNVEEPAGTSLIPLLSSAQSQLTERDIASEHNGARALRRGRWKLVAPVRSSHDGVWELYDLSTDRCETNNVAASHPELVDSMSSAWFDWARRVGVHPFAQSSASSLEAPADESTSIETPLIAQREIAITCRVTECNDMSAGVLLAHGGDQMGYSLHITKQTLFFTVRVAGERFVVKAQMPRDAEFEIAAKLDLQGRMTLVLNSQTVATRDEVPLIPREPIDRLSVGRDIQTAVGEYRAPYPFTAQVVDVIVETHEAR